MPSRENEPASGLPLGVVGMTQNKRIRGDALSDSIIEDGICHRRLQRIPSPERVYQSIGSLAEENSASGRGAAKGNKVKP